MTLYRNPIIQDFTHLVCDECGSEDLIETIEGYVCRVCGIIQVQQIFRYNTPFKADLERYARGKGNTQIGSRRERELSSNSGLMKRINRYNMKVDSDEITYKKAKKEIVRVLGGLGLNDFYSLKERALTNFKEIHGDLPKGSKYRNVGKLGATILYFRFRLDNIFVQPAELFAISPLTRKEFNDFFIQVHKYFPYYINRDRLNYICTRLLETSNHFGLELSFYYLSKKILYQFWEGIKNTTDNVIVGLCASIAALCEYKDQVKVNSICKFLNIRMSTIQLQVRKKIFEKFRLSCFSTLVRSAELLKKFMEKLGLVKTSTPQTVVISEKGEDNGIIHTHLGDALQTHNPLQKYYLFEFFNTNKTITCVYLEVYKHRSQKNLLGKNSVRGRINFYFFSEEYYTLKDPPNMSFSVLNKK